VAGQDSVEATLGAYKAAVYDKDVDAFVALYDDAARTFDMWGNWSYEGTAAIRQLATDWFRSLGDERVEVAFDEVKSASGDDVAVVHAFITFTGLSADGEKLRAMTNRITWGLRKTGGNSWKIVHEHTSAPADFETGKVVLERP
jgi:ketosteroid isomerase-like protein